MMHMEARMNNAKITPQPTLTFFSESKSFVGSFQSSGELVDRQILHHCMSCCVHCSGVYLRGADVSGGTRWFDANTGSETGSKETIAAATAAARAWLGLEHSECETRPRRGAGIAAGRSCFGASVCAA